MWLESTPRCLRVAFVAAGERPLPSLFLDERALPFAAGPGAFDVNSEREARLAVARDGEPLLDGVVDVEAPALSLSFAPGTRLTGFGAATTSLVKGNERFRLLTLDTLFYGVEGASYSAFPFFVARSPSGRTVGVLLHSTYPALVTTSEQGVEVRWQSGGEQSDVDLYLFTGSLADILDDYTRLCGRPFLPPLWSLGYQQSRWSYRTQADVLSLARRFRTEGVPCDAIYLDIHYMHDYRVFTWSPAAFPDPRAMHDELSRHGIRTVAIVDPGVSKASYPAYDEGKAAGVFLKTSQGDDYTGRVWPGETVFPDFSDEEARRYWARQHASLFRAGVSGIWNDMNDPVLKVGRAYEPLDEDVRHAHGSHRRFRNLYASHMAEATQLAFAEHVPRARPFVLTRSGFPGIQRHAALWTGDNFSSWEQLRASLAHVLSLGLAGVPFAGADIGGFGGRRGRLGFFKLHVERELFARWMELGAWLPLCRAHTVLYSPAQEPWSYGKRVLALCRRAIRRRYRFLPYLYALMREAHERGAPLARPMFFHDEGAPERSWSDQFLVGRDVLVAPVMERGVRAREVWLPDGAWLDLEGGERLEGGAWVRRAAPLGAPVVLVREGAVLPMFGDARNSDEALAGPLFVEVLVGPRARAPLEGRLYLDDGTSRAALDEGAYLDVALSGRAHDDGIELDLEARHAGYRPRQRSFELRLPRGIGRVLVDGVEVEVVERSLDDEDRRVRVVACRVPLGARRVEARYA